MTIRVTSLLPVSQTIDSVALAAFATQVRAGTVSGASSALVAAAAAKQIYMVDDIGVSHDLVNAAKTLTRSDSGKTFYLDLAGGFAVTLPALELGLTFEFVVRTAPTTAYTIVTASGANVMKGLVLTTDVNSATDPDLETSGGDTFSFVASKAVAGDTVKMFCDGTSWFARAAVTVFDAATITTAA
jgi:hypothetical protein